MNQSIMPQPAVHLAEAYIKMAEANHYLICVAPGSTFDELDAAEQVLITRDNAADNKDKVLNLAIDLLEQDRKTRLHNATRVRSHRNTTFIPPAWLSISLSASRLLALETEAERLNYNKHDMQAMTALFRQMVDKGLFAETLS